jgi:FkbM family methyltransferase
MKKILLRLMFKLTPYMQGRVRCVYYNFLQKISFSGKFSKFSLEKVARKSYLLKVGGESIYIAMPNRVGFYKGGIKNRINTLQKSFYFGMNEIVKGDVVIDIGSNIGEYALSFQEGVIIHAFEMDPNVIPSLLSNCNGLDDITIHNFGLWSHKKTMEMFIKSETADTSLIDNGAEEKHIINCLQLDDIEEVGKIPEIKLIKCDAEGAEPEVLRGAIDTLSKTKYVAIDCGPERGPNNERTDESVKELLISLDFEIIKERFGAREILIARNKKLTKIRG